MSALAKLFPNATPRPWVEGENASHNAIYRDGPWCDPIIASIGLQNRDLILHAVNTYDARDEALREARDILVFIEVGSNPAAKEATRIRLKIEAALADETK